MERELQSPKGDSEMQLGSSESIKLMPQIELKRVNDDVQTILKPGRGSWRAGWGSRYNE